MDNMMSGIVAGSVAGPAGAVYPGKEIKAKKKDDDNRRVEKKEGSLV